MKYSWIKTFTAGLFFVLISFFPLASLLASSTTNTSSCSGGSCKYYMLAPISAFEGVGSDGSIDISTSSVCAYLLNLYKFGIYIAIGLAVLMIVIGGMQYVSTDAVTGKSSGRERIVGALQGLILALLAYLILKIVNPQLVGCNLDLAQKVSLSGSLGTSGSTVNTGGSTNSNTNGGGSTNPATAGTVGTLTTNADGSQQITLNTPGLDTDGTNPPPFSDPDWSGSTSLSGLDSNRDQYVAVPNYAIPLGTTVTVTDHTTGRTTTAIVGDYQGTASQISSTPGKTAYGEMSIATAQALGINVTSNSMPNHTITFQYHTNH